MNMTKEKWNTFVGMNSDNSYSLVVCLCIMDIWEGKAQTKEEAHAILEKAQLGITGAQADMAISFALKNTPDFIVGYDAFAKED